MRHNDTTPTIHYDTCPTCAGTGTTPSGHVNIWGPVHGACRACKGEGMVAVTITCERCLNTGIDLEAPVNVANPPQCPCCQPQPVAA